ncbi:hypothetical protein QSI79_22805 [Enterobacter asburiae]|uniref:hypothetical protein n=1 Tax=Enterobacter asburiae TaxID=61645 RepID=UPI00287A18F5|nr:hypothetical protein [Enterobacter asburiae]MDS1916123.1 hypothetical protein [Enterobacter asburiae]
MMQTDIEFCVVGHHARRQQAEALTSALGAHLLIDDGNHGANWNHRRALEWAAEQTCRVVVLEDDAIPVHGFTNKASEWLDRYPDSLVSFYLGTSRPPQWQPAIASKLSSCPDTISLPTLIHGVCYSIPPEELPGILDRWPYHLAADFAIGRAWGRDVIYLSKSLVEHADGPSVERHPDGKPRTETRRAWALADALEEL